MMTIHTKKRNKIYINSNLLKNWNTIKILLNFKKYTTKNKELMNKIQKKQKRIIDN